MAFLFVEQMLVAIIAKGTYNVQSTCVLSQGGHFFQKWNDMIKNNKHELADVPLRLPVVMLLWATITS